MNKSLKVSILITFLFCTFGRGHGGGPIVLLLVLILANPNSLLTSTNLFLLPIIAFTITGQVLGIIGLFGKSKTFDIFSTLSIVILFGVLTQVLYKSEVSFISAITSAPFIILGIIGIQKIIKNNLDNFGLSK